MCWRQLGDVGDGFDRFCHQHLLSFNISVGLQQSKDVTNIEIPSLKCPKIVTEIESPTFTCHQHQCSP